MSGPCKLESLNIIEVKMHGIATLGTRSLNSSSEYRWSQDRVSLCNRMSEPEARFSIY